MRTGTFHCPSHLSEERMMEEIEFYGLMESLHNRHSEPNVPVSDAALLV